MASKYFFARPALAKNITFQTLSCGVCLPFSRMKAVYRVAMVRVAGSIGGKSAHNYRQGHVRSLYSD